MKYFFGFTDAKSPEVQPCCDIDVTGVFAANHQKALASAVESVEAKKPSNLEITNSALSEDGTKLASAGEHIVCVTFDRVEDDDVENSKSREIANEALKAYAKQFSGEDIAENKIYSLQEEGKQAEELKSQPEPDEKDDKDDSDSDESIEALKRATGDDDISLTEAGEGPSSFTSPDDDDDDKDSKGTEDSSGEASGSQTKVGYYFVYKLVIEGLKETTFSNAIKKMGSKIIDGVDIKVKFTSLFGGGGDELELSGKKLRQHMQAKVDPDKLINSFDSKIRNKFPSEKYGVIDVKIYDKNLMVKFLGSLVGAQEKKKILGADYSIAIKVPSSNKAREFVKPALIASLLNKAIAEVQPHRKGKNKVSTSDIIVVSNSKATEIKAANDDRQGSDEDSDGSSVFEESYNWMRRSGALAMNLHEAVDSQQQIFDLFFEDDGEGKTVKIKFKWPSKWATPTDGDLQDFDVKKELSVTKGKTYGSIKKNNVVASAIKQAQEKFDGRADWAGWVDNVGDTRPIKDEYEFDKDTVLVALYKRKTKDNDEDDLEGSGKSFDYYVIPMPGLKYPDKDDEQ